MQAKAQYFKGRSGKLKKKNRKNLYGAVSLLAVFILWTAAVQLVDVQPIGPKGSAVGFAAVNGYIHDD